MILTTGSYDTDDGYELVFILAVERELLRGPAAGRARPSRPTSAAMRALTPSAAVGNFPANPP